MKIVYSLLHINQQFNNQSDIDDRVPDVAEAVVGEAADPRSDLDVHAAVRPWPPGRAQANTWEYRQTFQFLNLGTQTNIQIKFTYELHSISYTAS